MTKSNISLIRIVSRPLSFKNSKIEFSSDKENWALRQLKEFLYDQDWQHYAVIINTAQQQIILHNLQNGFESRRIENHEIEGYKVIHLYQEKDLIEPIYEEDLIQFSVGNNKYNLINNSCIHFVNKVIIYLNERLQGYCKQNDKIQLNSFKHVFNRICKKSWKQIKVGWNKVKSTNNSKEKPNFKELTQNQTKQPIYMNLQSLPKNLLSLSTKLFEYIIWNLNSLSLKKVLVMFFILAITQLLLSVPILGGVIAIGSFLFELVFIWSQKDDTISEKIIKSLSSVFLIFVGGTCNNLVQTLFRTCFNFIGVLYEKIKSKIIKLKARDVAIVTTTTSAGVLIGHTCSTSISLCMQTITATCKSLAMKFSVNSIGAATIETSSLSVYGAILSNPVVVTGVIGLCVGIGCILILNKWF